MAAPLYNRLVVKFLLRKDASLKNVYEYWTSHASHYIGDHFDICRPLLESGSEEMDSFVRFVTTQLFLSCQFSSESSLVLLREGKEWDADIINRSIIEGMMKLLYIWQGTHEEQLQRAIEFWEIIPDHNAVKRSERAKELLEALGTNKEWKPIHEIILNDKEAKELLGDSNRKDRKKLAQKWSFSEIIKHFGLSGDDGLKLFVHLSHNYSMSSHLIHKDGDGTAIIWERCTREPTKQQAVKSAHISRVTSDLCVFADLRTMFLLKAHNVANTQSQQLRIRYEAFFQNLSDAQAQFNQVEYET